MSTVVTLVYDAEEYLFPLAVFERREEAEVVRRQVIDSMVEARRKVHERERIYDGDLPFNEQTERDWLEEHVHTGAWQDIPLVLAGETVPDVLEMARRSLTDYLSPDDDIWEALR